MRQGVDDAAHEDAINCDNQHTVPSTTRTRRRVELLDSIIFIRERVEGHRRAELDAVRVVVRADGRVGPRARSVARRLFRNATRARRRRRRRATRRGQ